MFIVTSTVAIALAGAARLGVPGAVGTLFFGWVGVIGVCCLYFGITDRSRGSLLALSLGIMLGLLAFAGFVAVIL